ncbi:MAG: hypothetical protein WCI73_12085, partial [Phycisphaerae bacterium]
MRIQGQKTSTAGETPALRSAGVPPAVAVFVQRFCNRLSFMIYGLLLLATPIWAADNGGGEGRFPPPDFRGGYNIPGTPLPAPRGEILRWVDVGLLAACLGVAAWA